MHSSLFLVLNKPNTVVISTKRIYEENILSYSEIIVI